MDTPANAGQTLWLLLAAFLASRATERRQLALSSAERFTVRMRVLYHARQPVRDRPVAPKTMVIFLGWGKADMDDSRSDSPETLSPVEARNGVVHRIDIARKRLVLYLFQRMVMFWVYVVARRELEGSVRYPAPMREEKRATKQTTSPFHFYHSILLPYHKQILRYFTALFCNVNIYLDEWANLSSACLPPM